MTTLTEPRFLACVSGGLIITLATLTGCTNPSDTTAIVSAAANTELSAGYCAADTSAHTLVVKDVDGHTLKLVRSPGYGWRYQPDPHAERITVNRTFPQVELSPVMSAHALEDAATERELGSHVDPLAVFIDGPTGYTFTWTGEGGWKFVGRVSD
jgi:hypothetical protein